MALARNQVTHVPPENKISGKALDPRPGEMEEAAGEKGWLKIERSGSAQKAAGSSGDGVTYPMPRKMKLLTMFDKLKRDHGDKPDRDILLLILAEQLIINQKLDKMSDELKNLQDAAAKTLTVEEAVLQVLTSQKATIDGLNKQLADAIAAGNPQAIQAVADQLNTESDKVNAAIAALNPPAAPAPDQPAPETPAP